MLELNQICVSFRSERQDKIFGHTRQQVLFDVSLRVERGTCLGILGESGSGKSTMGRVLCGLLKPDSGEVQLDGVSVYASRSGRRNLQNKLSVVFQDYTTSANPRFRVRHIIGESLRVLERIVKGGCALSYGTLKHAADLLMNEIEDCLLEGSAVNLPIGILTPGVKGLWQVSERYDPKVRAQNEAVINYKMSAELRKALENPLLEAENIRSRRVVINCVEDKGSETINERLTPGNAIIIQGDLLLMNGDLPERGLYYLNADKLTHPLRVLLVGVDRGGKVRKLLAEGLPKARILGYVGEKDQDPDAGECFGPPFMALEAAKKHGATMIVLLPDAPIDDDIAHDLLEAKLHGAMVVDIRTFYEHVVQRLPLSQITEEWLLQTEGFSLNTRGSLRRLKRAFDLFLSLMLLIPAAPIMLITALLIRLESPGPVIYRQDRVGLYEKEFTVYKFRSMRTDAEKNGAVWAAANDARVTRVGKFIRKVRIDELPQIWNIIKGDMSFIGPRPERMTFVKQLKEHIPYYSLRHTVKPGLTGWAQVCYPYGANEEDARHKLEYDLFYVKNISILLDIHIIFKTVGVVLFPKGAR